MPPRTANTPTTLFWLVLLTVLAYPAHAASPTPLKEPPALTTQVQTGLLPILRRLQAGVLQDRLDFQIDGVRVFESGDKFLPGKIAIGAAHLVLQAENDTDRQQALDAFRELSSLTVEQRNDSWGIYYYMSALHKLHGSGLMEEAVDPVTLAQLRQNLDWRKFVDPDDYSTTLPTNYYGVAFAIARLRYLLGWETEAASSVLLARTLDHYREHSTEGAFSDETEGEGRFDRYSILLIAELAHRFRETKLELPPEMKISLRKSAEFVLVNLNLQGTGFQFGRSIGPYGDTAFLEILSAAAWAGLLTQQEMDAGYAFSQRAFARYLTHWYDREMGSVNLWEEGRRTDSYRGKHRILGENLSLMHQLIETEEVWAKLGYNRRMITDQFFEEWLRSLPPVTLTRFSTGEYARAAVTVRDKGRVFSLWLVNGARNLYDTVPYYPTPFSSGLIESAAGSEWPQLVPRLHFADGSSAMPLVYFRNLKLEWVEGTFFLTYDNPLVVRTGGAKPSPDARASVATKFVFRPGLIERHDTIRLTNHAAATEATIEFAVPAQVLTTVPHGFLIASDPAARFSTSGFKRCVLRDTSSQDSYRSAQMQLVAAISCRTKVRDENTFNVGWKLRYAGLPAR